MILEGEIKDAKMSSFSSDFQTLIKRINEFEKSDLNPIDLFISLDVRPWMRVTIFLKQITEKKSCYLNLYLVFGTKHTLPKFSQALVIVIKT